MTRWRDEAAAVERARELLQEVDEHEPGEWSAWAWERHGLTGGPSDVSESAMAVAHYVEALRRSLRRFVAEHELAAARKERVALPGRAQPLPGGDDEDDADPESRGDDATEA